MHMLLTRDIEYIGVTLRSSLRWLGHVEHSKKKTGCKSILTFEVKGKSVQCRVRQTWMEMINIDFMQKEVFTIRICREGSFVEEDRWLWLFLQDQLDERLEKICKRVWWWWWVEDSRWRRYWKLLRFVCNIAVSMTIQPNCPLAIEYWHSP